MTPRQAGHLKSEFLSEFARTGNISVACQRTGTARATAYAWRAQDADFAAAWLEAELQATEVLEEEARRRASDGLIRKKFDKGKPIIDLETGEQYVEREYSDTLLIFLLKARNPEKYRERTDVRGSLAVTGGVTISYMPQMAGEVALLEDQHGRE